MAPGIITAHGANLQGLPDFGLLLVIEDSPADNVQHVMSVISQTATVAVENRGMQFFNDSVSNFISFFLLDGLQDEYRLPEGKNDQRAAASLPWTVPHRPASFPEIEMMLSKEQVFVREVRGDDFAFSVFYARMAANPSSRSAMISSMCSVPMDRRMVLGLMP